MPQPKKPASSARKTSARTPAARKASARADATRAASSSHSLQTLRDLLARGLVITGDRVQETMDDAVRRGRMTRDDAEEIVQSLIRTGAAQTRDVLNELEGLLGSADSARRQTQARVRSAARAARRAPGTDQALRQADRVRRAAGLGSAFPISGYDELTAAQIVLRCDDLTPPELRKVRDHERRNANRKSVLSAIERKLD